ncbi:MAG: hypothetical protein ACJAZK_002590 [Psychroserpens sp.]|jgi:hypothetical protein|uniref:hypothetical protein n=1 Tax=Psychroserpens sp. TaxID=2020870 RepID=UPI0039E4FD32
MKHLYLLLISIVLLSCGNERILQLPEIETAKITEINDVSHAYLFYDETKEDSVELNRKNLIITTNWLVNVDKRLTLGQAIPKIKFLQEKKRNAELHKNEDAKNYFTCNDTSIKNLGFLEFTDVVYFIDEEYLSRDLTGIETDDNHMVIFSLNEISLVTSDNEVVETNIKDLVTDIEKTYKKKKIQRTIYLGFQSSLSFQDYISIKCELSRLKIDYITIDVNESFIY